MARVKLEDSPESTSIKIAEGAYARKGVITKVVDNSNYPGRDIIRFDSGFTPELCFDVYVDTYGKEKKLRLFGFFQRDKNSNAIIGWNPWHNACKELLYRIIPEYVEKEDTDQSIPKDVLDRLVGKEIQYIRFVTAGTYTDLSGKEKPSFMDYSNVFAADATKETITAEFIEQSGYLMGKSDPNRKYYPEAIGMYGAKSEAEEEQEYKELKDETIANAPTDDDIPF